MKSAAATNRWNNNNGSTASNIDGHSKTSSISHGAGSSMLGTSTSASGSSTVAPGKSNDTFNGHSSSATYASPPSVTESSAPVLYLSLDPAVSQTSSPSLHIKGPKPLSTFQHPTFGASIEDVIQFAGVDNVPLIVRKCIEVIESYGLNLVGIYRISSNQSQVNKLKESIDANFTNYLTIGKDIDPSMFMKVKYFVLPVY